MQGAQGVSVHPTAAVLDGPAGHFQRVLRHPTGTSGDLQHARGRGGHHVSRPAACSQPELHGHVHQEPVLHR